jgi:hypothetical protein
MSVDPGNYPPPEPGNHRSPYQASREPYEAAPAPALPPHPWPGQPQFGRPHPPVAPVQPTNTMAVLALTLAFVFAPAGIVLGIIAKRQIRRSHDQGEGLATAGIVVGSIFTALIVLWIAFVVIVFFGMAANMPA